MTKQSPASMAPALAHFSTSDHILLEADLYESKPSWLILVHGKAYNKEIWKHGLAPAIVQAGWTVLAPNLRGYGTSQPGAPLYERDVLAAVNFARDQGARQLVVLGASMGGTALIKALALLDKPITAAILLSPAGQPSDYHLLRGKARQGLLLYSEEEAYADNCRHVMEQIPFPLEVHTWPGILHAHQLLESASSGSQAQDWILDFLTRVAGPAGGDARSS